MNKPKQKVRAVGAFVDFEGIFYTLECEECRQIIDTQNKNRKCYQCGKPMKIIRTFQIKE